MKKTIVVLVLFSFLGLQLTGCATMTGTGRGVAVGTGVGLAAGKLLGGDTREAIMVALAGAIIGAVIGNYYDKQVASRAEAVKRYEYKAREEKLEIEDSSIAPQNVAAGATVEANVQYVVLVPDETQKIKITETRILDNGNKRMKLGTPREVIRPQGIHHSTFEFTMPKDIEKGDYTLITIISDGEQTRTTKDALTVM